MFIISNIEKFTTNVKIHVPGAEPSILKCTFKFLKPKALTEWRKANGTKPVTESVKTILLDWDVVDKENKPVPIDEQSLQQLFDTYHTAAEDIIAGYLAELLGARRKN